MVTEEREIYRKWQHMATQNRLQVGRPKTNDLGSPGSTFSESSHLSEQEKKDVIDFLGTVTGTAT
jgi:hypothetical protein